MYEIDCVAPLELLANPDNEGCGCSSGMVTIVLSASSTPACPRVVPAVKPTSGVGGHDAEVARRDGLRYAIVRLDTLPLSGTSCRLLYTE